MYEILSPTEMSQVKKKKIGKAPESRGEIRPTTWQELRASEQQIGKSQDEHPLAYLGRNVLQTVPQSLALARSGLGLGDILEGLAGLTGSKQAMQAADLIMPSHEKAYVEQQQLWPEYMTQERPGDYWAQLGIPQAATTGASLYYGGPMAALRSLVPGVVAMGAGTLSGEAGEQIGGALGQPKLGRDIGSFFGTHLGGAMGHHIATGQPISPSGALPAFEEEAEAKRYATDKEQYEADRAGKKKGIEEQYTPVLFELEKQHEEARTKQAVSHDEFQQAQTKAIDAERNKVIDIEQQMETLKQEEAPLYEQAAESRTDDVEALGRLQPRLNYIRHKAELGTTVKEQNVVNRFIDQIRSRAKKTAKRLGVKVTKSMPGILSVDDAVEMLHAINGLAHDQEYGGRFYDILKDMTESLKEFVRKNGNEEHNAAFFEGLEKTTKRKQLEREVLPKVKKEADRAIQHIKEQPFTHVAELENKRRIEAIVKKITDVEKEMKEALGALGPERYEELVKPLEKMSKKDRVFMGLAKRAGGWASAGVAAIIGGAIAGKPGAVAASLLANLVGRGVQEFAYAREVMTKYPEIRRQYYNLIRDVPWLSQQAMSQRISHLGSSIKNKAQELQEQEDDQSENIDEFDFEFLN
jgi:hypothetical protein